MNDVFVDFSWRLDFGRQVLALTDKVINDLHANILSFSLNLDAKEITEDPLPVTRTGVNLKYAAALRTRFQQARHVREASAFAMGNVPVTATDVCQRRTGENVYENGDKEYGCPE